MVGTSPLCWSQDYLPDLINAPAESFGSGATQTGQGGTLIHSPAPLRFTAEITMPKRLQPVMRVWPQRTSGSSADCVQRTRAYPQDRFPKALRHHDDLPSQLRQPKPHTRPFGGVPDE